MHPKEFESAERRAKKAVLDDYKRQVVMDAAEYDIRFYHGEDGTTFAYRCNRRNIWDVSTALLHSRDQYSKREGNFVAAENMFQGRFIQLKVSSVEELLMKLDRTSIYY